MLLRLELIVCFRWWIIEFYNMQRAGLLKDGKRQFLRTFMLKCGTMLLRVCSSIKFIATTRVLDWHCTKTFLNNNSFIYIRPCSSTSSVWPILKIGNLIYKATKKCHGFFSSRSTQHKQTILSPWIWRVKLYLYRERWPFKITATH